MIYEEAKVNRERAAVELAYAQALYEKYVDDKTASSVQKTDSQTSKENASKKDTTKKESASTKSNTVKTGDASMIGVFGTTAVASGLTAVVSAWKRRKKK